MNADLLLKARFRWATAVLGRLLEHARLEGWARGSAPTIAEPAVAELQSLHDLPANVPFERLRARLGLTPVQVEALWLLACCELEPLLAHMAHAVGTAEQPDLTATTLQRLLECASKLSVPGFCGAFVTEDIETLARLGLIETTREPRLPAYRRWVRASDRVIDIACGHIRLDREIADITALVPPNEIGARGVEVPPAIVRALQGRTMIVATGSTGSGRTTFLENVAARKGVAVIHVRCGELARDHERLGRQLRTIARECLLFGAVPLLQGVETLFGTDAVAQSVQRELLRQMDGLVLVTSTSNVPPFADRPIVIHRMGTPCTSERTKIWRTALPGATTSVIDQAANLYSVVPGTIVAAATNASAQAGSAAAVTMGDIHEGLRAHLEQRLGDVAKRVECKQTWQDLVLPSDQLGQLVELVARVRHRGKVLEEWGFADKVGRGIGLAALISGPPGTGKTMVAGLLANELGLDLYQVDTSRVVSKYIGETEKNLATVFDAAESGHALLLFDEADSLFAKRSEVKSSNDRYANLEVNYLLQRIEQFGGICVLTTNHESALDEAFRRRLAIHLRFPIPNEGQRESLWRVMLPERAAKAGDIDYARLAQKFHMTGGYIKNAALRAAYLAADEEVEIGMRHLWHAAHAEYEAMGKVICHAA